MTELLGYKVLKDLLQGIRNKQHQALLCLIYACMGRVGEIVKGRHKKTKPMQANDIISYPNKVELLVRTEKTDRPRKIPVFRNREAWLCDVLEAWRDRSGGGPLFPYSTRWAEKIFKIYFPELERKSAANPSGSKHTIHWLRGWRYSHYRRGSVTGKIVESKVASLLGGWQGSDVPERIYDLTKIDDYEEMLENE